MTRVVLDFSMSLDGYIAGPNISTRDGMGIGGERLHQWMFAGGNKTEASDGEFSSTDARDAAQIDAVFKSVGAVIVGRRTYDVGLRHWGDTPYPVPSFVLTHSRQPEQQMKSASFRFITEGVETAIREAKAAAGGKDVIVMGGSTSQQVLRGGLADRLNIRVVSVLLCGGTRLFDRIGDEHIELKRASVTAASPDVTHLEYDVIN
jgi:dihydrofolate reductase